MFLLYKHTFLSAGKVGVEFRTWVSVLGTSRCREKQAFLLTMTCHLLFPPTVQSCPCPHAYTDTCVCTAKLQTQLCGQALLGHVTQLENRLWKNLKQVHGIWAGAEKFKNPR